MMRARHFKRHTFSGKGLSRPIHYGPQSSASPTLRWIMLLGGLSGMSYFLYSCWKDSRSPIHKYFSMPLLRAKFMDPETSHRLGVLAAKYGIAPREYLSSLERKRIHEALHLKIFGHEVDHVVGLAAGFDKNAEAIPGLYDMGFATLEVGTVTPLPQEGNPRPRVFRLMKDQAIINRYGFNSQGVDLIRERLLIARNWLNESFSDSRQIEDMSKLDLKGRLKKLFASHYDGLQIRPLIGINIGKNKVTSTEHAKEDYSKCVEKLAPLADYLVINVSSPNTAGLVTLQSRSELDSILTRVHETLEMMPWSSWNRPKPPIMVKVSPGLSIQEKAAIAELALLGKMQGIIVSNTTTRRDVLGEPTDPHGQESGGLSGKPIFDMSTKDLNDFARLTRKKVPLIGVGGIFSAQDAYTKIRNGAWLVQIYSGLVFEGPGLVTDLKRELVNCLERDGFHHITEARGVDVYSI